MKTTNAEKKALSKLRKGCRVEENFKVIIMSLMKTSICHGEIALSTTIFTVDPQLWSTIIAKNHYFTWYYLLNRLIPVRRMNANTPILKPRTPVIPNNMINPGVFVNLPVLFAYSCLSQTRSLEMRSLQVFFSSLVSVH